MNGYIEVSAIEINQNEKQFYVFKIYAKDLLSISYFKGRDIDRETGVQRPYKAGRSREIAEYIDEGGVLANNIIINLKKEFINFEDGILRIKRENNVAFIIDGQHRLKAFDFAKENIEIPVSSFIDLSLAEVAELFVKINYYQKSVNKSLVYDLLGISKDIFPEYYEAHDIVNTLNETIGSPWFNLIKMLGVGTGVITQAAFITALESNKILTETLKKYNKQQKILILSNYFEAVKQLFPGEWGHREYFISKTISFNALLKIFPDVFRSVSSRTNGFKIEDIKEYIFPIKKIRFNDVEIASLGGAKGVKTLSMLMSQKIDAKI